MSYKQKFAELINNINSPDFDPDKHKKLSTRLTGICADSGIKVSDYDHGADVERILHKKKNNL